VLGLGFGLIFAPALATATLGVAPEDAGVASAAVNANQQVGGSVGVALLSTIASSATASYISGGHPSAALLAAGTVHGYTTAFAWSGGIFTLGAVIAALLFRSRKASVVTVDGQPVPEIQPSAAPALAH
jgi:hypothetical protein